MLKLFKKMHHQKTPKHPTPVQSLILCLLHSLVIEHSPFAPHVGQF